MRTRLVLSNESWRGCSPIKFTYFNYPAVPYLNKYINIYLDMAPSCAGMYRPARPP